MDLCAVCGRLPRGGKNPEREARGRACPRWGTVDLACCSVQECSRVDARGAIRCDFARWARAAKRAPLARP